MRIRVLLAFAAFATLFATLPSFAACDGRTTSSAGTSAGAGGGGGAGGACPVGRPAMFTVTITAVEGPVPADTTLAVKWSAAAEPALSLDDPKTWKTPIDEEANVVCDLDPTKPPPVDLPALVCRIWSSGATRIQVSAKGYTPFDETLSPIQSERCTEPFPMEVEVKLAQAEDAGPP